MMKLFHGSPYLFDHFNLDDAGESSGTKFEFGVYQTESEASAVHYSQPFVVLDGVNLIVRNSFSSYCSGLTTIYS